MPKEFDLQRFTVAQNSGGTYESALAEIGAGCKHGHWMWFVFPQLQGLGSSTAARHYAIESLAEARAYLNDPVLGVRLRVCAQTMCELPGSPSAREIFGVTDAMKFRSSMTLFARAAGGDERPFSEVLSRYYGGQADRATERGLEALAESQV